jgi:hypothetical protein
VSEGPKFSFETLTESLNSYLLSIAQNELEIEILKKQIATREDFNIFETFKLFFDSKERGTIDSDDLSSAFSALEIDYGSILNL